MKKKAPSKVNIPFTKRGALVTRYLIEHPCDVSLSFRTLAELTEASVGTVGAVLDGLEARGHVIRVTVLNRSIPRTERVMCDVAGLAREFERERRFY